MKKNENSSDPPKKAKTSLLGIGFDNKDDQTRITRGKNFLLYGGSRDTHGVMQETAVKVNEKLEQRGKELDNLSLGELRDIMCDVAESIGFKPPQNGQ